MDTGEPRRSRCRRLAAFALVGAATLAGCRAAPAEPASSGTPAGDRPAVVAGGGAGCPATARLPEPGGSLERQGSGDGATLWALFFPRTPVLSPGTEVKVAWRMTGSGDLAISATGPDGTTVAPAWGPESHGASSWQRPGQEWGTGWSFPTAGCWTITARRGDVSGALVVRVADA
ncbi:hypothetical protein K7640_02005 [Micromonospora sp. PLK6-60]|uniref:hypothetical protein n=1 Tax=Micromonospora sp. PLK6-60 TaxID=2873383 RepID=UPI001CA7916B|nr:hypothetical protein [Micromonospora sp. PLK6-60]MBY8870613.1 hypothetical protein [Micromonospora sp. PLK6-60]